MKKRPWTALSSAATGSSNAGREQWRRISGRPRAGFELGANRRYRDRRHFWLVALPQLHWSTAAPFAVEAP